MSITLELSPELEAAVRERAEVTGEAPAEYIAKAVEAHVREAKIAEDREKWQAQGLNPSLAAWIARWRNRTPEEIAMTRDEYLALARWAKDPPPGKTWADMVIGNWPGDETDAEILAALERLS